MPGLPTPGIPVRNLPNGAGFRRLVVALACGFGWSPSAAWAAYPPQWYEVTDAPAALGTANLQGLAFGGSKFVVVPVWDSTEGKWTSASSTGGTNWTKGTPFPGANQLYAVA